jgi:hypothetical protein
LWVDEEGEMDLAAAFYPNPVPGFIAVIVVCGSMIAWAAIVAFRNFGPGSRKE